MTHKERAVLREASPAPGPPISTVTGAPPRSGLPLSTGKHGLHQQRLRPCTKKLRSFHRVVPKSSFYAHIELPLAGVGSHRVLRVFPLNEIDPEIAELLELLNAREQLDEIAELFEQSSPWHQYSEEERKRLVVNLGEAQVSNDFKDGRQSGER